MNKRKVMGYITISVIIGGVAYSIYKSKQHQKQQEAEITLEEAKAIVRMQEVARRNEEARRAQHTELIDDLTENVRPDDFIEDLIDECRDEASWNSSFSTNYSDEERELSEEEAIHERRSTEIIEALSGESDNGVAFYQGLDFDVPLAQTITEEDKVLRFDPNSRQAHEQFIKMELAEWLPMEETYQTMLRLFGFKVEPVNQGDDTTFGQIADYRGEFFGDSIWTSYISMADIILHYARLTDYNVGGTVKAWVEHFLEFNEFDKYEYNQHIDKLIYDILNHRYTNLDRNTNSLFGLTTPQASEAMAIAARTVDGQVTFDIEYNEFLKGCL